MQNKNGYSDIYDYVKTSWEEKMLADGVDLLANAVFEKKGKFDEVVKTKFPASVGRSISKLLKDESPEKIVEGLQEALTSLESARITFAFEPSYAFLQEVSGWFKDNVGKNIILDVVYDPTIVGAVVVEYRGKHVNLSLNKKIEDYFVKAAQVETNSSI